MFTKNIKSLVMLRCILVLVLLSGAYSVVPFQTTTKVYALGDSPGTLDITFGSDGLVTTAIGSYDDEARAVAIQDDGKIVVAGQFSNPAYDDFFVIRYNTDGSLDTSFDMDGIVITDFGGDDVAQALAIQSDGKIVVAGYTSPNGSVADFALARYNSDGSLDTNFDSDGKLITSLGSGYDYPSGIAIQSDDKIVVVGGKYIGINDYDIAVLRYNADGSPDTTFDTDGIVTTPIGNVDNFGNSIAIQPDGKIIVGGTTYNGSNLDWALVRYNSDGSLDTSFDTDGIVTQDFGIGSGFERGGYIALQPDGKIVIAGSDNDNYFFLARYNDTGALDTAFDTDGFVSTYMGGGYDTVRGVALQENGKIVIAGYSDRDNDFAVVRYNLNGSLDTDFATNGIAITDFGSNEDDLGNAVTIQSDGKIVVAGSRYIGGSKYDVAVARYLGDEGTHIYYVKSGCNRWRRTTAHPGPTLTPTCNLPFPPHQAEMRSGSRQGRISQPQVQIIRYHSNSRTA